MPASKPYSLVPEGASPRIKTFENEMVLLDTEQQCELETMKLALRGIAELCFSGRIAEDGEVSIRREEIQAVFRVFEERLENMCLHQLETIMVTTPVWGQDI
jgi:hypothetical protein